MVASRKILYGNIDFEYDKVKNKSKCIVTKAERDDNGEPMTCEKELVGKFTTDLKNHMRSQNKEQYESLLAEEKTRSSADADNRLDAFISGQSSPCHK